jgi:hypothetical protein
MANKLLIKLEENEYILQLATVTLLWEFICKNADFLTNVLYDLVLEHCYQVACEDTNGVDTLQLFLSTLRKTSPEYYGAYLEYVNKPNKVSQLLLYLRNHPNLHTNRFYIW